MKTPILSICIPSFNHATALEASLLNITSSNIFLHTNNVEVIISDNASTDNTEEICRKFERMFVGKLRYYRNDKNIRDRNFGIALSKGRGQILKLHNNYYHFTPNGLQTIVDIVQHSSTLKPVIFLGNGVETTSDSIIIPTNSLDEFVDCVSFNMTWIGGFFIWREDFISSDDFSTYAEKSLSQCEVLLRCILKRKYALVINARLSHSMRDYPRTGYNIAEVFAENYLELLGRYLGSGELSQKVYDKAKQRVLLEHILPSVLSDFHDFKNENLLSYFTKYQNDEYFYLAMHNVVSAKKKKLDSGDAAHKI